ncbi:Rv1733c family protein [Nocardia heshunensis]
MFRLDAAAEPRLPSAFVRLWRLGPWNRNPLMRTADRMLSSAAILGFALCLLAVPIALTIGTAGYTAEAARIRAADAAKTEFIATVVTDPVYTDHHNVAEVVWHDGNQTRSQTAPVGNFAFRGAAVHVWLSADGTPAAPPAPAGTALLRGIGNGTGFALAIAFSVWIALASIRHRLETCARTGGSR